jgi:hypothetical protein
MNTASLSGSPEVFGFFSTDTQPLSIVVEPSFHTVDKIASVKSARRSGEPLGDHIVYRHSSHDDLDLWLTARSEGITIAEAAARRPSHFCGNDEGHEAAQHPSHEEKNLQSDASSRSLTRQTLDSCDIPVVGDSRFFAAFGSSFAAAAAYVHAIMAGSNSIYRAQTSNGFTVTNIYMYESAGADPFLSTAGDYNTFLNSLTGTAALSGYGAANKCLTHGFTASNWGGVAGLAWIGTVCSLTHGSGVTTVGAGSPASVSSRIIVTAHEIGHNWGSQHDSSGSQIMAPSSGPGSQATFSQASLNYFAATQRTCLKTPAPDNSISAKTPTEEGIGK